MGFVCVCACVLSCVLCASVIFWLVLFVGCGICYMEHMLFTVHVFYFDLAYIYLTLLSYCMWRSFNVRFLSVIICCLYS